MIYKQCEYIPPDEWDKGAADSDGYFTITNRKNKKILAAYWGPNNDYRGTEVRMIFRLKGMYKSKIVSIGLIPRSRIKFSIDCVMPINPRTTFKNIAANRKRIDEVFEKKKLVKSPDYKDTIPIAQCVTSLRMMRSSSGLWPYRCTPTTGTG